jgi:hypothetical protein
MNDYRKSAAALWQLLKMSVLLNVVLFVALIINATG